MKWMLAVIMSVAMVSPALASVDITLTAADGTNLIVLPAGTTTATVQLAVGLGKPTTAAGVAQPVSSFNVGLTLGAASVGSGTFKVTARAANTDTPILGIAGCVQNSLYTDPDTFESFDQLLTAPGNGFGKGTVSGDLGWTAGTNWVATKFPGVIDTVTVELKGLQSMDNYVVTLGDPGAGIVVVNPAGAQFPIGALGSVTISVLPEPASLLLLALGGLFLRRRHA